MILLTVPSRSVDDVGGSLARVADRRLYVDVHGTATASLLRWRVCVHGCSSCRSPPQPEQSDKHRFQAGTWAAKRHARHGGGHLSTLDG